METLYAKLGELLVQGEILGLIQIPNAGQIGDVKKQIANALKNQNLVTPKEEPKKEDNKKDK